MDWLMLIWCCAGVLGFACAWVQLPAPPKPKPTAESRLREEFIRGDIEADEFEQRLEAILRAKESYSPRYQVAAQFRITRDAS